MPYPKYVPGRFQARFKIEFGDGGFFDYLVYIVGMTIVYTVIYAVAWLIYQVFK